jgi:hypothetical protein
MAQAEILKGFIKPPFANYDIVVYFGCGLFSLPFIKHYIMEPFGLRFPVFAFDIGVPFAGALIATLSLLFTVYILGHIIAYVSSQLIEKAVETAFAGKTSTVLLATSKATDQTRKRVMRERLKVGCRAAWTPYARVAASVRLIANLPAFLVYLPIYAMGIFGFYSTRIPPRLLDAAARQLESLGLGISVSDDGGWFKVLEGAVINNHPIATARMYNYLVISGLFRSIALIFLGSLGMELVHLLLWKVGGWPHIGFFLSDSGDFVRWIIGYLVLSAVYAFSLFSFLKFQRRYVEEAIFAFVLAKDL